MPLTAEQNELLTRVEKSAPMGQYLRQSAWFPAVLSSALLPNDAPYPVRLLGEDFVAFRAAEGRVGFFAELCPHRGASLLLARNEDNALRCIFHGWKFRVDGATVEVPTQVRDHGAFCKKVPLQHYPTREAAGIVWVWLGKGEPGAFYDFDFMEFAPDNVWAVRSIQNFNWIQAVEGLVDSAHIAILHQDWLAKMANNPKLANAAGDTAPVYEIEERPQGFRYAAIRNAAEGKRYIRITEFATPWSTFIPSDQGACFMSVPIDDKHTAFWAIRYDPNNPINDSPWKPATDPMNWPPPLPGGREQRWGQDRKKMTEGSFSGFEEHFLHEDLAVALGQGVIATRAKEFLNAGDIGVVRMRNALLREVNDFTAGKAARSLTARPRVRVAAGHMLVGPETDWRTVVLA